MSRPKKPSPRGPSTVVLDRELIDALDAYRLAHPLKPGRRHVVAAALKQYIRNGDTCAEWAGDKP